MQKRILWIAAALALIAIPAVIGLVALRGDDSSSEARRAAALLTPQAAEMAGKTTIEMRGGKSTPVLTGKQIDVQSFSWGVANNGTTVGAGAGAGKANFSDFSFTKKADESSPGLMQACAVGEHYTDVTLNVRKTGTAKGGQPYLTIKFTDVIISGFQQSGPGDEGPEEQVSLNYAKIDVTYRESKADGSLGAPFAGGYDLQAATKS